MRRAADPFECLERARARGLARYVGHSGDGAAARHAVECGRFDVLQTSVSVADQEALDLTLPLALERGRGVIAKRPLANAAWRHASKPAQPYHQEYWSRLRELDYPFLRAGPDAAAGTALPFTLSVPGIHTAIVGTARPGRPAANAALLAAGPLPRPDIDVIRARWREVAGPTWTGEIRRALGGGRLARGDASPRAPPRDDPRGARSEPSDTAARPSTPAAARGSPGAVGRLLG